ncbi:MAG TPA: alpha-galactosidase [Chitinophagaceae bacterium]|nr:alpha-galactosidase [Chitinophagaceae bacterium]
MKRILLVAALYSHMAAAQTTLQTLPAALKSYPGDWLIRPTDIRSSVYLSTDKKDIVLYNGLVKRVFRLSPNVACIEYTNLSNGQQLLRAVKPEAVLKIDGKEHKVGGLYGQKEKAYLLNTWVDQMTAHHEDLQLKGYEVSDLKDQFQWKPVGWSSNKRSPTGKVLSFAYSSPLLAGLLVKVHYEIYDGLPLIVKYVTVDNSGNSSYKIDRVKNEILDLVEEESAVIGSPAQMKTQQGIYIETNYAFNNAMRYQISDQTTHWLIDSSYTSQVNYNYQTPCVLEVYPDKAPGIELKPGEKFQSVRTYELLMDSYDRERRGLFVRKMYNKVAPWTNSNPIFMHLVSKNDDEVIRAVDQCDSTGYEAVILSFGSHLNMEDQSDANLTRWKKLAAYAHGKGIMIGGYSLFSSRKISDEDDVISPATGKPGGAFFGNAPCFGSKWGIAYRDKIKNFFSYTGFDIWENDGPYPGDVCASVTHPGHKGLDDSQWRQMEMQKELYRWLNEKGVYINAPDWYFLDGTHKIAIGYREVNFSLPRENQKILNRQNIFDGTWEKTPSMGWGFVPLVKYQGGGPEAVLEPLSEHLKDYEQLMMQYYGAGVQACYRGPRLYDTERTRQTVIGVINWYKKYREILNSDLIHLRRADGRNWDGWLHVNPALKQKGLMMLFNPTNAVIKTEIAVPLYYTGMHTSVKVREKEGVLKTYPVSRDYKILLPVTLQPGTYSWWVME